jgi:RNA polymerase sigma factor (sigma-70 family)
MPARPSHPTQFATTRWTLIREAARGGDAEAVDALGALFLTYWPPLYRYARRQGKSPQDSEDLVQGFMAHLVEARALSQIDREKGRFRSFLLASFNHWMINEWKHESRLKRGGGIPTLSFDWESAETGLTPEFADSRSPDKLYDREWAMALLGKVLDDLQTTSRQEGNGTQFEILKPCLTADSAGIPYTKLAEALGTSDGAARVAVHRLRKRYRHLLTAEVARTLASPDAVEEEMRSLFAALAG